MELQHSRAAPMSISSSLPLQSTSTVPPSSQAGKQAQVPRPSHEPTSSHLKLDLVQRCSNAFVYFVRVLG